MPYSVLIPTAGTGSRLGDLSGGLNKSLLRIGDVAALTRIIDQFPLDTRFVIVLGYGGEIVAEYLRHAHDDRDIVLHTVDLYQGPGSGLGRSILAAADSLNEPFIFTSCDTLVEGVIPPPDVNWVGVRGGSHEAHYRGVTAESGLVTGFVDKGSNARDVLTYTGIAGISDHDSFWSAMCDGGALAVAVGEFHALARLDRVETYELGWWDTGNPVSLARTRARFASPEDAHVLDKPGESIWILSDRVVKYSKDTEFITNRVHRATDLGDLVPSIRSKSTHMYSYQRAKGHVLSRVIEKSLMLDFLSFSNTLWEDRSADVETDHFRTVCDAFYRTKSRSRIDHYLDTFKLREATTINGTPVGTIAEQLGEIDWAWLADGTPVRFHGDYHFENVIYDPEQHRFTLLDWRQDFGGIGEAGDIYYDLAKLMHGILVPHEMVVADRYQYETDGSHVRISIEQPESYPSVEDAYRRWLQSQNLDIKKVDILTALVLLNIAVLHHEPYAHFLFNLGRLRLARVK